MQRPASRDDGASVHRAVARGFTLVELMVGIAIVVVLLALAAPSFNDYILTQRMKATAAELVTDVQYARSEATSRGKQVFVVFHTPASGTPASCYTIYTDTVNTNLACDCREPAATRCATTATELRTQAVPGGNGVRFSLPVPATRGFVIEPAAGGILVPPTDFGIPMPAPFNVDAVVDTARTLRVNVALSGRPLVCRPAGSTVSGGYPSC